MTEILTAAEMRALEQEAIGSGEVTGLELMERAGKGVVEAILAEWPEMAQGERRAVVLCGPGNNGGDGFVVARLLKERGWEVEVFLYGDAEKMPPDARVNFARWCGIGEVGPLAETILPSERNAGLIVDALFGTGLARPIIGLEHLLFEVGDCVDAWSMSFRPESSPHYPWVVAIDVPSGLCSDSGRVLLPPKAQEEPRLSLRAWATKAHVTVTFHSLKPGHVLASASELCGKVIIADIGLSKVRPSSASGGSTLRTINKPLSYQLGKWSSRHKYSHGHALLLSGGCGRGGAARLAARGALRIGAGLVTLAVPPAALQENAARLDAIMLRSVRDAEALSDLLSDPRLSALAAGPGLGTSDREAALLHALLDASRGAGEDAAPRPDTEPQGTGPAAVPDAPCEDPQAATSPDEASKSASDAVAPDAGPCKSQGAKPQFRPVVLDADALTLLARHPGLRAKLHPACILTPHEGEFARLFPAIAERLRARAATGPAYSKVDAARGAAREAGCIVLLKGPDTVIAAPPRPGTRDPGRAAINAAVYDRAAPWLATAGSGDVLAGMICGLLARGLAPFDAACTAAWLHVECARSFGPGLIAEDLPEELPKVFRGLNL